MDRVIKYKYILLLKHSGFTLIELMIAMLLSSLVIIGVYTTFISQNKSYVQQERLVEIQQTLRTVFMIMGRDIRMAGYNPTLNSPNKFTIVSATHNSFEFGIDLDEDGNLDDGSDDNGSDPNDPRENYKYELYDSNDPGSGKNELHKMSYGNAIAYDISALEFAYAYAYDSDGSGSVDEFDDIDSDAGGVIWAVPNGGIWFDLDTDNDGDIDINDTQGGVSTGRPVVFGDIRMVRISLLVRSSRTDGSYFNKNTYIVGSVRFVANDHYRRKLGTSIIRLRNM